MALCSGPRPGRGLYLLVRNREPLISTLDATANWTPDYARHVDETMRRRTRLVIGAGSAIYLAYSYLDFQVYPDFAPTFLPQRIVISLVLAAVALYTFAAKPRVRFVWLTDLSIYAVTLHISYMIYRTNGVESSYYQGINVCFLAMVSVNMFFPVHAFVVGVTVFLAYLAAVLFNPAPVTAPALMPPVFFMSSTVFFVTMMARLYGKQHEEQHGFAMRLKDNERLKDEFFANVSHELRTPLSLILGPARKLLRSQDADVSARRDLATIERNALTLLRHVDQILDLSKLDAGMMKVEQEPVDLAALVRFVASHFELLAAERGIALVTRTPDQLTTLTDREKVERILFNLLSNALKYVPAGGHVKVGLDGPEGGIRLTVADDGPGIPEAMRESVFERFRQVDGGSTRRHGGTGLGLAIVREFAQLLKGQARVEAAAPHGAIFEVTLPFVSTTRSPAVLTDSELSAPTESLAPEREAPVTDAHAGGRARILVVEDHPEMSRFVAATLAPLGRVETAANGAFGLEAARRAPPDLVVTDLMMPEMSGAGIVAALRSDPALAHVPVLMLSAKADEASKVDLLRAGAHDYMHKPFVAEELVARCRNLIEMKRVRDVLARDLADRKADLVTLALDLADSKRRADAALTAAEAASRSKDEFLLNLSHELRTPLTAILGWSELCASEKEQVLLSPADQKQGMDAILRNARALLTLVDDLLDLARIAQGKLRLDLKPMPLRDAVNASLSAVEGAAAVKGVTLAVSRPEGLDARIVADRDRLQQVIWNLVSNAVKFTPKGGHVSVSVDAGPHVVEIAVTDSGQGIDPEFLPRVFERFEQGDSSSKRRTGGLGLGLAIARHLVELHGGEIGVSSAGLGRGSRFTVKLPRTLGDGARH